MRRVRRVRETALCAFVAALVVAPGAGADLVAAPCVGAGLVAIVPPGAVERTQPAPPACAPVRSTAYCASWNVGASAPVVTAAVTAGPSVVGSVAVGVTIATSPAPTHGVGTTSAAAP